MKNTLAIQAAVPAIPPKPKMAAMIATIKNVSAQFNINFLLAVARTTSLRALRNFNRSNKKATHLARLAIAR